MDLGRWVGVYSRSPGNIACLVFQDPLPEHCLHGVTHQEENAWTESQELPSCPAPCRIATSPCAVTVIIHPQQQGQPGISFCFLSIFL